MGSRPLAVVGVVLAGVAVVGGKRADLDVLAKVGATAAAKVNAALPPARLVAAPLAAFKPGRALPVEERVRVRIAADKRMGGADVDVLPGAAGDPPNTVRLRGVVPSDDHRRLAVALAADTVGVDRAIDELAVPDR